MCRRASWEINYYQQIKPLIYLEEDSKNLRRFNEII